MDYNLNTLSQYRVMQPGQPEIVRQRMYDYQLYPTAGQAQLAFFQLPIGQGASSALGAPVPSAKTYADTNMEIGGQLAKGKSFLAESIEVIFEPGAVATAGTFTPAKASLYAATIAADVMALVTDANTFRVSGWLEFYILSKTYLWEAPLGAFPPKTRFEIDAAVALAGTAAAPVVQASSVGRAAGRAYYLDPPITLDSNTNFTIYLKWPGAVATPSGFNGRVGVVLDGVQYRLSQ